jgi:hypothetical protein
MNEAKANQLHYFEALGMELKIFAYYENSLEGKLTPDDGGSHPFFPEYASAFVGQKHLATFVGKEAAAMLREKYPPKPTLCLPEGMSLWSSTVYL